MQKYLESPLLVPLTAYDPLETTKALLKQQVFTRLTPPPLPLHTPLAKFDMRVWVLVTSFQPLTAYIYSTLYGRRCSTAYDLNVDTLHDSYTHLTNYSVQKKQKLSASGSTASMRRSSTDPKGNSTDNSDLDEPDLSTTSSAASSKVDLHALSKADTSVTRRLRSTVGSARNNTSSAPGAPPQSENVSVKRLSEADLLVCKFNALFCLFRVIDRLPFALQITLLDPCVIVHIFFYFFSSRGDCHHRAAAIFAVPSQHHCIGQIGSQKDWQS